MYNFVSLSVKCPFCEASLMDQDLLVDNEPSIKLKIKAGDKVGTINLSSIYGSYNYICSFDVPENTIATFICPSCNQVINSKEECKVCRAPLVPFHLDMGGQVSICSRAGCRNHFVEFEDLTSALARFYQEYGYINKAKTDELDEVKKSTIEEIDENVEIIESGTFLYAYCPYCKRSLIELDMLKLKIVSPKEEVGYIMLSPYLNVFSSKSTIFLPEGKPVGDLRCFHCDSSLMVEEKEKVCEVCSSPVARISISARSKLIDFYLCSKKGCRWHGLSEEDINEIRLEDSMEW